MDLDSALDNILEKPTEAKYIISICCGAKCNSSGAKMIQSEIEYYLNNNTHNDIKLETNNCIGQCHKSPNLKITKIKTGQIIIKNNIDPHQAITIIKSGIENLF